MTKPQLEQLPLRIGIAADLVFSIPDHVGYLADCLLVHDEVVIPLNASVLNRLEGAFDTKALRLLIKEGRIRFCPSYSLAYANKLEPAPYRRDSFIESVRTQDMFKHGSDRNDLFAEIEETFLEPKAADYAAWLPARDEVDQAFDYFAGRPGYEFLFPSERYYYQTGAVTGVARMNDLLAAGIPAMGTDNELPKLLELCFPLRRAKGVSAQADILSARKVVRDLHSIKNLPTFEIEANHHVARPADNIDRVIRAVLSEEAHALRVWLSGNLTADLDVRAAYDIGEKKLPSKRAWTKWARFGLTSGVGTVAGMLLAGPVGAAAGVAIGAADMIAGQKATSILDGYHPRLWLSHAERIDLFDSESVRT